MQSDLANAQTNISSQQKQIQDVQFWVNNIFSRTVTETFPGTDTNRVIIVNRTNGPQFVFFKLDHVPILSSVHAIAQSPMAQIPLLPFAFNYENYLACYWQGDEK